MDGLNNNLWYQVKTLSNLMHRQIHMMNPPDAVRAPSRTTGQMMGYLFDHAGQDVYQKDLEKAFMMRRSTVSGVLQGMEKDGMIRRESVAADKRLKKIVPTEKASRVRENFQNSEAKLQAAMLDGISEEEVAGCIATLVKVKQNLEKQAEENQAGKCICDECPAAQRRNV